MKRPAHWTPPDDFLTIVSTFPPSTDGIARYAGQMATDLESRGVALRRLGISPTSGGSLTDMSTAPYALKVISRTSRREAVLLHWHPHYYAAGTHVERVAKQLALALLFRLRAVTVLVHEPDDVSERAPDPLRALAAKFQKALREFMWAAPATYAFHTPYEMKRHLSEHPRGRHRKFVQVDHGASFRPSSSADRAESRTRTGVSPDLTLFVCLGFINPHKGFDRAIRAVEQSERADVRLHIAGSRMRSDAESVDYVERLRGAVARDRRITFDEGFLSDEEFDLWVMAADAVLAPYRFAASSSVLPRAQMLGTKVITSGSGGLRDQVGPEDVLFTDDDDLAKIVDGFGRAVTRSPRRR